MSSVMGSPFPCAAMSLAPCAAPARPAAVSGAPPAAGASELQRLRLAHLWQRRDGAERVLVERLVDAHQRDRLATLLGPPEMEGRDVHADLARLGAERPDEARRVVVHRVEHV